MCIYIFLFYFLFFFNHFSWLLTIVIIYPGGQFDGAMAFLAACTYIYFVILIML